MKWKQALIGAALVGALSLGSCALFQQVSTTGAQAALNATRAVLTGYYDVYQPALLTYGRLPDCPATPLCKSHPLWLTLKDVDARTVAAIVAAKPILDGSAADTGQVLAALDAVRVAESQIIIATGKVPQGATP